MYPTKRQALSFNGFERLGLGSDKERLGSGGGRSGYSVERSLEKAADVIARAGTFVRSITPNA